MSVRKLIVLVMVTAGFLSFTLQSSQFSVYTSYIFHFTKYTEWPAEMKSGDFVIGILGTSDLKKHIESLAKQKKVGAQSIVVKEFTTSTLDQCHMLFIPKDQHSSLSKVLAKCKSNHTMIMTESGDATKNGSIINFFESGGKVKFELSMGNAEAHDLKVSTFLQRLAVVVD